VLAPLAQKPMLRHVYERASQARYVSSLIIATDDERIFEVARSFGARVRILIVPADEERIVARATAEVIARGAHV